MHSADGSFGFVCPVLQSIVGHAGIRTLRTGTPVWSMSEAAPILPDMTDTQRHPPMTVSMTDTETGALAMPAGLLLQSEPLQSVTLALVAALTGNMVAAPDMVARPDLAPMTGPLAEAHEMLEEHQLLHPLRSASSIWTSAWY